MELIYGDNVEIMQGLLTKGVKVDLAYCDCIYESFDFSWLWPTLYLLKENGIFILQTDYHSVAEYKVRLDSFGYGDGIRLNFVNWCIMKQEWGGVPRKGFPQKHDDILIYSKGKDFKWYGDRIQIPKVTAGTKLDKKGTGLKTPCSVFDDLGNFSTISRERIKTPNGKNIQWQKSLKLMNRLLLPFTDENDLVLDCFMGSNTTGLWCKNNNRNFIGIENNKEVFDLAVKRLNG
jgi:hypothetical protein